MGGYLLFSSLSWTWSAHKSSEKKEDDNKNPLKNLKKKKNQETYSFTTF